MVYNLRGVLQLKSPESSSYEELRPKVHVLKPAMPDRTPRSDFVIDFRSKSRNSRTTYDLNGKTVQCKLNAVSPSTQAFIGLCCLSLLEEVGIGRDDDDDDDDEDDEDDDDEDDDDEDDDDEDDDIFGLLVKRDVPRERYPQILFLVSLVKGCYFGMLMEAHHNPSYAHLVGLSSEYKHGSEKPRFNGEYIRFKMMIEREPIMNLIISMNGGRWSTLDIETLVNGVTSLCALPGSIFEDALKLPDKCDQTKEAQSVVHQFFTGTDKGKDSSNGGSEKSDYFNIKWEWF